MSIFISKALRRAEVFLEQVDETVAQASRRLAVEGATGAVDDNDADLPFDEHSLFSRASSIPTAENRTRPTPQLPKPDDPTPDAWDDDVVIDDSLLPPSSSHPVVHQPPTSQIDQPAQPVPPAVPVADELPKHAQLQQPQQLQSRSDTVADDITNELPSSSTDVRALDDAIATPQAPSIGQAKSQPRDSSPQKQMASSNLPSKAPTPQKPLTLPKQEVSQAQPPPPPQQPHETEYATALKSENAELRKELEHVEKDFETSRRDRTKLVKNLKRMKDIVSEMDESLRDKSTEARQLQEQLLQTKDELQVLQAERNQTESRGKDELQTVRKQLTAEITQLRSEVGASLQENETFKSENDRLKEALLHGHEVDQATADGARQEATQAQTAYETETLAHRETRKHAKEREEALQEEAALATVALATAQRKAEECSILASDSKSSLRTMETKLSFVQDARDAAFARIDDLEESLRMFERTEGEEAPGQKEAKVMQQTVGELENALEAKNVELTRLEGELEALRAWQKGRRDGVSPRAAGRSDGQKEQKEVEQKLRHMANAALRKQAQLEVMRSENRALQHQLGTERKRTREAQAMAAAASSSTSSIRGGFRGILNVGGEDRTDRMFGLRDGPLARFRTPRDWPRMISKTIGVLDGLSAQALAFLRREPLLRIVVLIYVVALHIFVYCILHWHVSAVTGSVDAPHARVVSVRVEPVSK